MPKKKNLNKTELGIFKASQALAREAAEQVDPEGVIRHDVKVQSRADTVKDITRKEALTGKSDPVLSRFREQLVRESIKEQTEKEIQFRERERTSKQPSDKEDTLTPAQQKLRRLKTGRKNEKSV